MTRYFFHVRDGDRVSRDKEGTELPDVEAARLEAILAAREMMAEMLRQGLVVDGQVFEITDEQGVVVEVVPFRSAMRLR